MLLSKIARNHAEDTISDVIWCICKQDIEFAEELISNYINFISDFTIIDIVRNLIITDGYMPDLTFLLRHKKTKGIVYIIIETKITASQNIYNVKYKPKKQFEVYTRYLIKQNSKVKLAKKYNIPQKCILLSPSYYEKHSSNDNIIHFRFPQLVKLLYGSNNKETDGIRNELITFIKEDYEGTYSRLQENLEILGHKNELKYAQNQILLIREAMLDEYVSKTGLWQNNSFAYYFGVGLKNKYQTNKNDLSWLSYDIYSEDEVSSPIRLNFPKRFIKKKILNAPQYLNKYKFQCDILNECIIDENFINIFKHIHCSSNLKDKIFQFALYYSNEKKKSYLKKYNKFFHALISFVEKFDNEISEEYHTFFRHSLNGNDLLLRLKIKKNIDGKFNINIIAEPTCFDAVNILRIEVFNRKKLLSTQPLLALTATGYKLKFNVKSLAILISETFENLYN